MRTARFPGIDGVTLTGDVGGDPDGPPVILMHGGGQTRGAWGRTARVLAEQGYGVISLDLRGHGESDWAPDAAYDLDAYVGDLLAILKTMPRPPALVGASLGGVTGLVAIGEGGGQASALVLVDVTPRIDPEGAARIGDFMRGSPEGFASVEEAADAIARYLPHRPRPRELSGLRRNLRTGPDGRLHWHWDPKFLTSERRMSPHDSVGRLEAAARQVRIPTLLVRGSLSEIVTEEAAREFGAMVPGSEFVDVVGAGHMVAGDQNTPFNAAILDFLGRALRR